MNILGIEKLIFGVNDLDASVRFMQDFGLNEVETQGSARYFEALDGSGILVAAADDASLPQKIESISQLRKIIYAVADQAALNTIQAELAKDRSVNVLADGSLETRDDAGLNIGFQISKRRELDLAAEKSMHPAPRINVN